MVEIDINLASELQISVVKVISLLSADERLRLFDKLAPIYNSAQGNDSINVIYKSCVMHMISCDELPKDFKNLVDIFFMPIRPFLIDHDDVQKIPMRIQVSHKDAIWNWICKDALADKISLLTNTYLECLKEHDFTALNAMLEILYDDLAQVFDGSILVNLNNEVFYNRFSEKIGGKNSVKSLEDILFILKYRNLIEGISLEIQENSSDITDQFVSKIKKAAVNGGMTFPNSAYIFAQLQYYYNDNFYYLLRYMYANQKEIVYSNNLISNEFLPCLELILNILESHYVKLHAIMKSNGRTETAISAATSYYAVAKIVTTEIEFSKKDRIGLKFLDIRNKMTNLIKLELDDLLPQVNAVFRAIKSTKDANDDAFDYIDSIENKFKIFNVVRSMGSEIALNDFMTNIKNSSDKSFELCESYLLRIKDVSNEEALQAFIIKSEILLMIANAMYDEVYVAALRKGFSVISPNKMAKSG